MTNLDIFREDDNNCLTIILPPSLDTYSIGPLWDQVITKQQHSKPKKLVVDATKTDYCDSAGIALLTELDTLQRLDQHEFEVNHLKNDIQSLLKTLTSYDSLPPVEIPEPSFLNKTGRLGVKTLNDIRENISFIGEFWTIFFWQCRGLRRFRWQSFWAQVEAIGPKALPISALLGFVMGLILSFQALMSLNRFGATIYTVNLVTIALTRELGALLTAVILAGRTASSFAAEIGTMKINQEVDALTTMGIAPMHYLVLPRVIAGILITPVLTLYLIFFGFLGCFCVMHTQKYPLSIFMSQLFSAINLGDLWVGLFKAFVFGTIITFIGCIHGLRTKHHAAAVGESTTGAVVSSIVMLAIADGILTVIFYAI